MSVLLDTNVLSELQRTKPDAGVSGWFAGQAAESLFVSSVTQAEMMLGVQILPPGKRRTGLEATLRAMFEQDFAGRILPFDHPAASLYAEIVSARRSAGRPISQFDGQIAAIAKHHGLRIATRNVVDFEGCGLAIIDPWITASSL